ncbi:MAG: methionine synthase [Candidatus Methanosuratincola sp.]
MSGSGLEALENAVRDQIEAGIEIISDGQTRKDMVAYFADHIPGFEISDGRAMITGKVCPPEDTPLVQDLIHAKRIASGACEVKAIITGPVTMAFFSELAPSAPYSGFRDEKLYTDIGEALAVEAEIISKNGFATFQFDEPSFSIGAPMDLAKKALEAVTANVKGVKALHVCGNLKRSFREIVRIEGLDILSFAFKDNPGNFDTVDRKAIVDHGKKLGAGCISSMENKIEEKDAIRKLLERLFAAYEPENIAWIHPDCGLRALDRAVAVGKLREMVRAVREAEAEAK